MTTILMTPAVHAAENGAGSRSKRFTVVGAVLIAFGLLALLEAVGATQPRIHYIGFLMMIAGAGQAVHALGVKSWGGGRFALWCGIASGVIYGLAGLFTYSNPGLAASALTLLIAVSLIAAGFLRIWSGGFLRALDGSGWLPLSGAFTVLVGVVFLGMWPSSLASLLAADLAFQGVAAVGFGLALRHLAK